ncbi:hypothetical protein A5810_002975 [Enterococcus faecium]|uniref:Transposase IS200-like domain-containing protein n=1 Tax=Enterococcus faecium TaxID=1352 RepID=A0A242B118_ENTFC|nr:hypothetical protein A5810_002975 [Enterococcus faecium]
MADVYKGRDYVYSIQYHVVWCVKYRHDVLTGEIEKSVKKILCDIASEHEFTISEMETDKDHIHLLIECKPQHYIPNEHGKGAERCICSSNVHSASRIKS